MGLSHESRIETRGTSSKSSNETLQVQDVKEAKHQDNINQWDLKNH